MLDVSEIRRRLPHAGDMVLIDSVDHWDDTHIRCRSRSHLRADNPLRREGKLAAVCAAEYGGQAMALHGSLRGGGSARPGLLASLRDVTFSQPRLDHMEEDLSIEASLLLAAEEGYIYSFSVAARQTVLVEGRAVIVARRP